MLVLCSLPSAQLLARVLIEENIEIFDQMINNNSENDENCEKIEILMDTLIFFQRIHLMSFFERINI